MPKIDYTKMGDKELLDLYSKLNEDKKPVHRDIPQELHKRKLVKSYTGTFNSNMKVWKDLQKENPKK